MPRGLEVSRRARLAIAAERVLNPSGLPADNARVIINILCIDDRTVRRRGARAPPHEIGHHPVLATSVDEGLKAVREQPFDLIISDYRIAGTHGARPARAAAGGATDPGHHHDGLLEHRARGAVDPSRRGGLPPPNRCGGRPCASRSTTRSRSPGSAVRTGLPPRITSLRGQPRSSGVRGAARRSWRPSRWSPRRATIAARGRVGHGQGCSPARCTSRARARTSRSSP